MRLCCIATLVAIALPPSAAPQTADLDALYQSNRWFEFRDAVLQQSAPAFYRGELALAFHDWDRAEKEFNAVLKSAADPVQAFEAGLGLQEIYELSGRRKDARALFSRMDAMLRTSHRAKAIDSQAYREFKSFRQELSLLSDYPDQAVTARGRSRLTYTEIDNQLIIPLQIDGAPANYMIDSGSSSCLVSESEASRLGLAVHRTAVPFDAFGAHDRQAVGVAVASDVVIGNFHLRNVMFLVDPDEDAGIIGLPVLLALQTLRWSSDGTIEFGFPPAAPDVRDSNLCLVNNLLLARAQTANQNLVLVLDTGSYESFLLPRFAENFPALMRSRIEVGPHYLGPDITDPQTSTLPDLSLTLGGLRARLSPALVYSKDPIEDTLDAHGWLGLDLFGQARTVTLDLASMRLTLTGIDAPPRAPTTGVCALPPDFACAPGLQCIVKPADADAPCFVDRVPVEPRPGNSAISDHDTGSRCVLPTGANCPAGKLCRVILDSAGSCRIVREDPPPALLSAAPVPEPITTARAAAPLSNAPDGRDIVRRWLKYDSLDLEPERDYIHLEDKETRMLRADGSVLDTTSETREVMNLYDAEYSRLIRRDGKDLPPNKARAEQSRFDKAVEKRAHETPEAKARREEAERKQSAEDLVCEDEFVRTFDYRVAGSETVNGRAAWIIDAAPAPHPPPRCHGLKMLDKFHLKVWIDQAEFRTVRFEAENIAPVTYAAVLMRVPAGGLHLVYEETRHPDGVWLASRMQARINVRALLFAVVRQEIVWTYTGYRKFKSDSVLMPVL